MEMRDTRPLERSRSGQEKQIGRLMKCLISSAPVSQVDPMSAHSQMVEADPEILNDVLFYPQRRLKTGQ